jgi:hypothetical protein
MEEVLLTMLDKLQISAALTATILAVAAGPLLAAPTVKCQDDKGVWHYGDTSPEECAKSATQVISKQGIPGKTTERELTPAEIKVREDEKRKKEKEKQKELEVERFNRSLLVTYSNVQEIDIARDKALQQAEDTIRGIQQKISDTQAQQISLQKEAATYKGKPLPAELKTSIDDADKDLLNNQQLAVSKRKELDSIRARFEEQKRTYIELTGVTPDGKAK